MIEQEKIEEIKKNTDLVALISQYLQLKKVGKNYRALCPFHSEKTPSFYVNPEKGIFYCFGCKKGGNAINFLMEYEKLDFPEAIRKLAKNLGIAIDTTKNLRYKELYEANEFATQFYSSALKRTLGQRGQNYLAKRGIDLNRLKEFKLGFAPSSGGLITFIRQKGVGLEVLQRAGLVTGSRETFHDRLIFPIFNLSGRVIGFGGRGIDDYIQPKYLNSSETPIFKKGDNLYGLYQSKETIRAKNEALIVEGYFDLLSLYQNGICNICAPLGTSLTENQAKLLARFARRVNILFDGDLSGIKAALRAIGLLIDAQVDLYITSLPADYDPDKFINEKGTDELKELIASAPDFFTFYKKNTKIAKVEDEVVLIKDLIQIINKIRDPIRSDRYLKYAARVFNISLDILKKETGKQALATKKSSKSRIVLEERLLAMILNHQDYFHNVQEILTPEDFNDTGIKRLYDNLIKKKNFDISEVMGLLEEKLREKLLSILINEERLSEEDFVKAIKYYKNNLVEKEKVRQRLAEAIKNGDEEAIRRCQEFLQKGIKIIPGKTSKPSEKFVV